MSRSKRDRSLARNINGIVLLDKPYGMSSNGALQQVKRLFHAKKAGHTGALDPLATGLLPICLGEATKYSQFSLDADKEYLVEAYLGKISRTGDAEGEITDCAPIPTDIAQRISDVLPRFLGTITQTPPIYSALKIQGVPLYEYARNGEEVEVKSRQVTIHSLEYLSFDGERLKLRVLCSKGTYIRSLMMDIGTALGCGAYVSDLHRTFVDGFSREAITLEALTLCAEEGIEALDSHLWSTDTALQHLPILRTDADDYQTLKFGLCVKGTLSQKFEPEEGDFVRLYNENNHFLGLAYKNKDGLYQPKRLISFED